MTEVAQHTPQRSPVIVLADAIEGADAPGTVDDETATGIAVLKLLMFTEQRKALRLAALTGGRA